VKRNNRTSQRPLFDVMRPNGNAWQWTVTYHVASSGYVQNAHVEARRLDGNDVLIGTASCDMAVHDDLLEVLEFLAVESMLAACTPELFGNIPHRSLKFVSSGF